MSDPTSDLRTALRVLRAERDLTQKALAEAAGLSAAYVSQLESGQKRPSMDSLERLAAALDVSVSALLAQAEARAEASGSRPAPRLASPHGLEVAADQPPPRDDAAEATPRQLLPRADGAPHRGRGRELAEQLLRDPSAAVSLVERARAKEHDAEAWRLGDVRPDLRTLIDLLEAYASGSYRAVPWESLVLVVAGLQYYVAPQDVVPDFLEQGYLDDAAVLAFVTEMIAPDLDAFTAS